MLDAKIFLKAVDELEEKGISREVTIQALKESFESIFKKKNYEDTRVECDINVEKATIEIFSIKTIVEDVMDDNLEIALEDALLENPEAKVGEDHKTLHTLDSFTKADAMKFKSVLRQKIKEAEKAAIYAAYSDKEGELITGVVEKVEPGRFTLINIGRTTVSLHDSQKIGDETFKVGQTIKVYLSQVNSLSSGPKFFVSRADAGFLKRLFEEEIPEIFDGTVVIKEIAREAGERSKVAVYSTDPNVDPIGACIGTGGSKIQKICSQLGKEKIDIVLFHEYPGLYIAEALKPAGVIGVKLNEEAHSATAIVKNDELRVAIGKRGINAILAVKLTNWKIDIKEQDVAISEGIVADTLDQMARKEETMLLERRRQELLKLTEKENEVVEEVESTAQEVTPVVEETKVEAPVVEETKVEEVKVEVAPVVEAKVETPVVEETKVEEEPVVEYNPVRMQPKVSLADLEKQIEEEKKKKTQQTFKKKTFKKEEVEEEEEVKKVEPTNYMSIYTDEELEEFEYEDEEENQYDDDDIDYSEYDSYYDE